HRRDPDLPDRPVTAGLGRRPGGGPPPPARRPATNRPAPRAAAATRRCGCEARPRGTAAPSPPVACGACPPTPRQPHAYPVQRMRQGVRMTTALGTFMRDGLVFDVLEGGPDDGEGVILLHGFPESAAAYDGITPALNAGGYRTFAPDQRGYSPGARPLDRRAYRVPALVDDVLALAD